VRDLETIDEASKRNIISRELVLNVWKIGIAFEQ
jgi:hypothetical protein